MEILPIKRLVLRGAFSERGSAIAIKVKMIFRCKEEEYAHEFYVVEKLAFDVVLGIDFLTKYKMQMMCDETIEIKFRKTNEQSPTINAFTRDDAEVKLQKILDKNTEVFEEEVGRMNHYEHQIEINLRKPFKKKTYPVPEMHMERVRTYIEELEEKGIISMEATQYINPLVVVVKKNGKIRLCLDARELNKTMTNDHAQPPTIEEVFRRIGKKKYFTTLDITNAFWQIPLEQDSRKYTGFLFDGQTYVFNRMPFGLKTAGASFTRAMELALGAKNCEFMTVYLDDVLIASNTLEEHLSHIKWVLGKLKKVGFRLNRDKCEFMKEEIKFLGHSFSEVKAEINNETKMAVINFERPRNKKAVQAFLGLVNWDRRFIKNLARMTQPLEVLLKKGRKFEWAKEQQEAFNEIKRAFQEAPDLCIIRPDYQFGIFVDAARSGLGARLYQYQEGSDERHTVGYASKSLKGAEINYTVTELECLAMVWALRKWHTLLLGRHVKIHTDHQALKFLNTCINNNGRIAR